MSVKIKAVEIETGDTKIKLSVKEAKELYKDLHELFGNKNNYFPVYPIPWYDRWDRITYDNTPIVTCGSGALSVSYVNDKESI